MLVMVMSEVDITEVDITGRDTADVDDSCYIRGPPGTGKTTQSIARIHRLLDNQDYDISDVVWVTYRRQLADETLGRLSAAGVVDEDELDEPTQGKTRQIGTFHAVGYRALLDRLSRSEMKKLGADPHENVEVAGEKHKIAFCKYRNIDWFATHPWEDSVGELVFSAFNWMQTNLYDPSDPEDWRKCPQRDQIREEGFEGSLTHLWQQWQNYKKQNGIIDYAQMLSECLERGIRIPDRDILVVDEFHDATPLVAEIVKMWADDMQIVIVAGDEDQIVNGYAGPSRGLFHDIRQELDLDEVFLDHSHRVSEEHWQAAKKMLNNAHKPPKISRDGFGGRIVEHNSPLFVPSSSKSGWGQVPAPTEPSSPVDLRESYDGGMMFLARMRVQVSGISYALDKAGIIHECQSELGGWMGEEDDRLELHNAIQKLKVADISNVAGSTRTRLSQYSDNKRPLDQIILSAKEAERLLHHTPSKHLAITRSEAENIRENILDEKLAITLAEFHEYVDDSFWHQMTNGATSARKLNTRKMDNYEKKALIKAVSRYDEPVVRVDTEVKTIHAAKGGEADHVVLYDGISRRIESEMYTDSKTENNEWRTWYVALTRSSDTIHIMRHAFSQMGVQSIIPSNLLSSVEQSLKETRDAV
jgi:DNA helicase-2/ATP-dependent DNA helicase PcrA